MRKRQAPIVTSSSQRVPFRIFLASSAELAQERSRFPDIVGAVDARPDIERRFELHAVTWEHDAFGVSASIHETIVSSTQFDTLDVIVLVVWNRLGEGTLREYEEARALWDVHKRPQLLVFFRTPSETSDSEALRDVLRFKRRLIDEGVATNEYASPEEFEQRLLTQLGHSLRHVLTTERTPLASLYTRLIIAGAITVAASAVAIFVSRTMGFPTDNVSETNVYLIIFLPFVLFIGSAVFTWYYHRTLECLKGIWHSPEWPHPEAYEAFRNVVPRFAIPARLRDQFPGGRLSTALTVAALAFVFLAPVAAQYDCLFEEILVWEYTVSHDFDLDAAGRAVSRYVDRNRSRWPFGLQDEAVRARHRDRDARTIYVHAQGQFARNRNLAPSQAFRRNLGPEVFLPWQPWLYLVMMVLSFAGGVWTFARLTRFSSEFRA